MTAVDKILVIASVVFGAAAGYAAFGSVLGAAFGVPAGIGVLGLAYWFGDEVDAQLRKHYRRI
jgi:hypothetical protein